MTAQPLLRPRDAGFEGPKIDAPPASLAVLVDRHASVWDETSTAMPVPAERHGWWGQWVTFRRARRLIAFVADALHDFPHDASSRESWRRPVEAEIRRFGAERLGWPAGYGSLLLGEEFFDTTVAFVRQARAFDPQLGAEEIGQALRNVWIVNSLQLLLGEPIVLTPSILAYSLLYPYTDNALDDPGVSDEAKASLASRLGRRLAGERVEPEDDHQDRIFRLVGMIERQFDRRRSPGVFASLLAIHHAQIESLRQHRDGLRLSDDDVVRISIAKGGASVLADGYLVTGALASSEEEFCFGYGVFLQLLDDLQDARLDAVAGHRTLFSSRVEKEPLDREASRLYHFMHQVIDGSSRFGGREYADPRDLILRNCRSLLVAAVAEDPTLFSREFVDGLERRWPLRFKAARKLNRMARARFSQVGRDLCAARGVDSVMDLVGD